jgi:hypothetical protein
MQVDRNESVAPSLVVAVPRSLAEFFFCNVSSCSSLWPMGEVGARTKFGIQSVSTTFARWVFFFCNVSSCSSLWPMGEVGARTKFGIQSVISTLGNKVSPLHFFLIFFSFFFLVFSFFFSFLSLLISFFPFNNVTSRYASFLLFFLFSSFLHSFLFSF